MTSASSLHFGPEWMRKPSRGSLAPLSPNTTGNSPGTTTSMLPTPPAQAALQLPSVSSYSSLLTSASPPPQIKSEDEKYPFRYSKEQLLRVWKDGGGRGGLGLEVERWPGIVREVGGEPLSLKEMTPDERKLFSTSVNSDPPMRRNANLSLSSDRQGKLGQGPASPRGIGAPRRRGTGSVDDSPAPFLPRKLSLSSTLLAGAGNNAPNSPGGALPSPNARTRHSGFDGSDAMADVWSRGPPSTTSDAAWNAMGARRRVNEGGGTRAWGGATGTPSMGLGIGRGISFGSLTNGLVSGNGSIDEKTSPLASPGPAPVSNIDAIVHVEEVGPVPQSGGNGTIDGGESLQHSATIYATNGVVSVAPTPVPEPAEDFASVQWSYKDPTGQIQGPFAGATMQQWFEAGYFSDDLLIKRTIIDPDFEPLRDIRRRAPPLRPGETHVQMFLCPLAPRAPPNLPPPQPHLRGNTPPNPSPRLAHLMIGMHDPSDHGPMSAGINSASPLANSPAARSTTLDSHLSPSPGQNGAIAPNEGLVAGAGGAVLTNVALERKKREEFIQSLRERELAMGVGAPSPQAFGSTGPFGAGFIPNPTVHQPQYSAFAPGNTGITSAFNTRLNMPMPPPPIPVPVSNAALSVVSPFPHNGPVLWSSSKQLNTSAPYSPSGGFDHATIYQSVPNPTQQNATWQDNFAPPEPRWGDDPEHHILPPAVEAAANVAEEPIQTPISDTQVHESPSSFHPSLPAGNDAHLVDDVTTALQETVIQNQPPQDTDPESAVPQPTPAPITAPTEVSSPPSNKRKSTSTSNKGKATTTATVNTPTKESVAPVPAHSTTSPASPPASGPAKAWATADEDKPASLSLREIQEAEARKAEAHKAAVPPPSTASDESPQAVTGSWGLPQVGARATAVPAPATNGAPAWTKPATAPSGKKSMKEIQEEEEKRKKSIAVKEAQSVAAAQQAAKRAYAESAKNVAPPTGGAWTTVGQQGKASVPPAAVRQPSSAGQTTPASRTVPSTSIASGAARSSSNTSTTQPGTKPAKQVVPDETPVPPSLDFLKWLKEALKGLNGVNVEEFMQMLLSFPLDPSPAVIEIISDSIYANSSTLDGRRFAAEFCQKRKADAVAARAMPGSASGAKVPRASLADVVKTQPKPVQSEWGFKTVQKKLKGGRK